MWLPWPLAVLLVPLLWLFPKRLGLHFGRVAWPGVLAGHLLWTIYGIGCVSLAFSAPRTGLPGYIVQRFRPEEQRVFWPVTLSEAIRSPAALLAAALAQDYANTTEEFLLVIGGTVLAVGAIGVVGGGLLMPWAADGDRRWKRFVRCAKLSLWSTSCLVVLGLALQVASLVLMEPGAPAANSGELTNLALVGAPLTGALWLWILIRSGLRHAGVSEGPDFEPRRPLCEACGYVLTGLTPAGNCPECGRSVAASMPFHRRDPAFARARTVLRRITGLFATWVAVVFDRGFFKNVTVRNGFAPARRFALWSAVLSGLTAFAVFWAAQAVLLPDAPAPGLSAVQFAQTLLIAWTAFALLVMIITSLLLQPSLWRGGPFRPAAIVVFYSSAWAVPLAGNLVLAVQTFRWAIDDLAFWTNWRQLTALAVLLTAVVVWALLVAQLVVLRGRIQHALRGVRFTNA